MTTPEVIVPVTNAHSMRTRGKGGFWQPMDHLNLHTTTTATTPVPSSIRAALLDLAWRLAMQAEFDALQANDTWTLVPRPPGVNLVTDKWVFVTSSSPMALLTATKPGGCFAVSHSVRALIMMRPSVQLSSQQPSGWYSLWHCLAPDRFTSLM